jgi:hypothetical protein
LGRRRLLGVSIIKISHERRLGSERGHTFAG